MLHISEYMCSKIVLLIRRIQKGLRAEGYRRVLIGVLLTASLTTVGCVSNNPSVNTTNTNSPAANIQPAPANANVAETQPPPLSENTTITLPVIDAMFADESFADDLKSKAGLTDDQVSKLQQTARDAVLKLDESDLNASTKASTTLASNEVKKIVGDQRVAQVIDLVRQRWEGTGDQSMLSGRPNAVPTDTRIVINAPA